MIRHTYIHLPFCKRKCKYCSFVSGFDINLKQEYITALLKQIKSEYKNDETDTLYLGGGTPSLLNPSDTEKIFSCFDFAQNAEITLETNPETVEINKFKDFRSQGINRISLGGQTFDNDILSFIGRKHSNRDIAESVDIIKKAGFENISIDLIYGLPGQTFDKFKKDILKSLSLGIKHISCYGLKTEPGSYFFDHPPENIPDDELQSKMYSFAHEFFTRNGFEHYEISNFAIKGFESRHNVSYWKNRNYYGFGLNASGYLGNIRYTNTRDYEEYIKNPCLKSSEVKLTPNEILEEEIFLALRLAQGIDISDINNKFNINFEKNYQKIIDKYSSSGLLKIMNNRCFLTLRGFLLSNEVMSEFIDV